MSASIVIEDGRITQTISDNVLWNGQFSAAWANGPIIQFVHAMLPANSLCVIPKSDGNINRPVNNQYRDVDWDTQIQPYLDYANQVGKRFIIGTLAQETEESDPNVHYLYLPLDDIFFVHGIFPIDGIPWEKKSSELCWRGGCSGFGGNQSVRVRFVQFLFQQTPDTDVRLSDWWALGKDIPEHLFRERIPYTVFFQHKIIFIVDGNVTSSNFMYAFASGSVPLVITKSTCWLSAFIQPFVHYIPVRYDLSDLIEKIQFVHENDAEAKRIAMNAVDMARSVCSPEFQQKYIQSRIQAIMQP
jgi:hypothetical protein